MAFVFSLECFFLTALDNKFRGSSSRSSFLEAIVASDWRDLTFFVLENQKYLSERSSADVVIY